MMPHTAHAWLGCNYMMTNFKNYLTQIALGPVLLHLGRLLRGGRRDFHWAGIRRELTGK